jgi:hypothetical protein
MKGEEQGEITKQQMSIKKRGLKISTNCSYPPEESYVSRGEQ